MSEQSLQHYSRSTRRAGKGNSYLAVYTHEQYDHHNKAHPKGPHGCSRAGTVTHKLRNAARLSGHEARRLYSSCPASGRDPEPRSVGQREAGPSRRDGGSLAHETRKEGNLHGPRDMADGACAALGSLGACSSRAVMRKRVASQEVHDTGGRPCDSEGLGSPAEVIAISSANTSNPRLGAVFSGFSQDSHRNAHALPTKRGLPAMLNRRVRAGREAKCTWTTFANRGHF